MIPMSDWYKLPALAWSYSWVGNLMARHTAGLGIHGRRFSEGHTALFRAVDTLDGRIPRNSG
jgi:hypothetical protein